MSAIILFYLYITVIRNSNHETSIYKSDESYTIPLIT